MLCIIFYLGWNPAIQLVPDLFAAWCSSNLGLCSSTFRNSTEHNRLCPCRCLLFDGCELVIGYRGVCAHLELHHHS
uniref:Secreted protein n=1 Tax=Arundo donax TaxID=35708 RepID=A0A0A9DFW1_ARUDO